MHPVSLIGLSVDQRTALVDALTAAGADVEFRLEDHERPPTGGAVVLIAATRIADVIRDIDPDLGVVVLVPSDDVMAELEISVALSALPKARVVHADDAAGIAAALRALAAEEPRRSVRAQVARAVADVVTVSPQRDSDTGVADDLRHRSLQLRLVMDVAEIGTWRFRPDAGEVDLSAAAATLHHVEPGSVTRFDQWWASVFEEDRDQLAAILEVVSGRDEPFSLTYRTAADPHRWLESRGCVEAGAVPPVYVGVVVDVSERMERLHSLAEDLDVVRQRATELRTGLDVQLELTERLELANQELARSSALRETILRSMSHDLGNRLTAIVGFAETLHRHRHRFDDDQVADLLRRIAVGTRRMEAVIGNLLDLDELEGEVVLSMEPADVAGLVTELCSSLAEVESWPVHLDLPPDPLMADISPAAVSRIVENLVRNAVQHAPPDSTVTVRVQRSDADGVALTVTDEGPGVPEDQRTAIFLPRHRAVGDGPGRGLGLAVVAGFARAHGGSVLVRDGADGVGAEFVVTLREATPVARGRTGDPPAS